MKKPNPVLMVMLGLLSVTTASHAATKPNVLWILTDDQRYDSIRAFNKMLHGREMSELGYVESPNVDRLSEMGATFINSYCQAQGCAPSRASMHYGRYPFRSGVYEFEYHNNNAEHCQPTLPERMAELGYQTTHIGKLGVRLKTVDNGRVTQHKIYQTDFYFKELDPALYRMPSDPHEVNNLALNPEYKQVAEAMQKKLLSIVLGDNRVEVSWGPKADGTNVFHSNFMPGADDKKLNIPPEVIPGI